MKIIIYTAMMLTMLSVNLANADSKSPETSSNIALIQATTRDKANEFGLSVTDYVYAAHRFELLMSRLEGELVDLEDPGITLIADMSSIKIAQSNPNLVSPEIRQNIIAELNLNKAKLANFLGIDVSSVDKFVQEYGALRDEALQGRGHHIKDYKSGND